ncbi:MAG: SAM-dependent methyltransferase [Flavobacteriaceae bacterium]|nr:SAM-dependent methyltransferase [Flavobacteriaceae bacterium]
MWIQRFKVSEYNKNYWENNYKTNQIGWDIGYASPPITNYIDQLANKDLSILIPGAGNAYEAEYLFNKGYKNVNVLDIAKQPLANLEKRIPAFPKENLIQDDFFKHDQTYDLIIEQTFYCAISPKLRSKYANKIYELLNKRGKLAGLLFDFPLTKKGPPFGGSLEEYKNTFSKQFHIKVIETSHNSIKPRLRRELFIIFEKK